MAVADWDVQSLVRAVDALLVLHHKGFDGYIYIDICTHCSDDEGGMWAPWPCATVRAIEEARNA